MSFLKWLVGLIVSKLLQLGQDLLAKWQKRKIKKGKDQSIADEINRVTNKIYELEDAIEERKKKGLPYAVLEVEIKLLEERLRDLSKMDRDIL